MQPPARRGLAGAHRRGLGDAKVHKSAVRSSAGWVTRPASASAEVQLEPDHPPVRASEGAPPTGQRVHQLQPAAAERLQVVRSALRGGARTGVIDLDPQPIVAELKAHLNVPPEAPEAVWRSALVVTSLTNSRATSRIGESSTKALTTNWRASSTWSGRPSNRLRWLGIGSAHVVSGSRTPGNGSGADKSIPGGWLRGASVPLVVSLHAPPARPAAWPGRPTLGGQLGCRAVAPPGVSGGSSCRSGCG